jgi:hypothetical protein
VLELALARGMHPDGEHLRDPLAPVPLYLRPAAFRRP